jgi:predicted Holliday junction resolvase-like endonuclease
MSRIKKIDKIFTRKSIDPRDIRLVCSPVNFISFNGMTHEKDIESIEFINHRPRATFEEKTLESIERVVRKGNVDFVLVRVSDRGAVSHDSLKQLA